MPMVMYSHFSQLVFLSRKHCLSVPFHYPRPLIVYFNRTLLAPGNVFVSSSTSSSLMVWMTISNHLHHSVYPLTIRGAKSAYGGFLRSGFYRNGMIAYYWLGRLHSMTIDEALNRNGGMLQKNLQIRYLFSCVDSTTNLHDKVHNSPTMLPHSFESSFSQLEMICVI